MERPPLIISSKLRDRHDLQDEKVDDHSLVVERVTNALARSTNLHDLHDADMPGHGKVGVDSADVQDIDIEEPEDGMTLDQLPGGCK